MSGALRGRDTAHRLISQVPSRLLAEQQFFGVAWYATKSARAPRNSVTSKGPRIVEEPAEPYTIPDKGKVVYIKQRRNNVIGPSLNKLTRLLSQEGLQTRWRARETNVTASEQRVLDRKASEKKFAKQKFRKLMSYIMQRKERGF